MDAVPRATWGLTVYAQQFSTKLVFERKVSGQDAAGQPVETWENVFDHDVWGNIKYPTGLDSIRESIKADVVASVNRCSIRIPYLRGITADMRVKASESVFMVRNVMPDIHRKQHVDIFCEVVNNGY